MAYPIATKTLRDTAAETIVHTTGLCGSGEISATNIFDCSAAAYGLATITLLKAILLFIAVKEITINGILLSSL